MMIDKPLIHVAAGAVFPHSKKLEKKMLRETRFGEPYTLATSALIDGTSCTVIPRGFVSLTPEYDHRDEGCAIECISHFTPHPKFKEQPRVIAESVGLLKADQSHILKAPTGFGKTYVGAEIAGQIGRRTLFVTTKEDIIEQWVEALCAVFHLNKEDIGLWQADRCDIGKMFTVGLVHSVLKGAERYGEEAYQGYGLVVFDECFTPDHEVLTSEGWKYISDVSVEDKVAQVDTNIGTVSFAAPERIVQRSYSGDLIHIQGSHCDLIATPNHEHFGYWNGVEPRKVKFGNFKPTSRLHTMYAPNPTEGDTLNPKERLAFAYQADGHWLYQGRSHNRVRFTFRKARKIERMRWLLNACDIEYTESVTNRGETSFCYNQQETPDKSLSWVGIRDGWWCADALQEIALWDGWHHPNGGICYESSKENVEVVQIIATLAGRVGSITQPAENRYRVSCWAGNIRSSKALKTTHEKYTGSVHCVTMPHGTLVVRHKGKVTVTGNCHRMGAETFSSAIFHLPAKLRLGLSATPQRKDGKDEVFQSHIGNIRVEATDEQMVPKVLLVKSAWKVPRVRRNGEIVKLPHTAGKAGHITKHMAGDTIRTALLAGLVTQAYEAKRTLIVFADSMAMLQALEQQISSTVPDTDVGYYVGLSQYKGAKKDKQQQREAATVKPVILATYQMASEATNIPWLDACLFATPRSDVVQIVGRIRREYEGKQQPVVMDVLDNDSLVFARYADKRVQWYHSIGAEVQMTN